MLTLDYLRERLAYNPDTGVFTWLSGTVQLRLINKKAGVLDFYGYQSITLDNQKYRGARLAWFYMTGEWPLHDIDHVNGIKSDDRWTNLRAATKSENMRNTKLRYDNKSGVRGVSWNKRLGKWHVRVNVHNKLYHCGYFDSLAEATIARDVKALELHGAFARLHSPETTPAYRKA